VVRAQMAEWRVQRVSENSVDGSTRQEVGSMLGCVGVVAGEHAPSFSARCPGWIGCARTALIAVTPQSWYGGEWEDRC
jgi:hypothetical protein